MRECIIYNIPPIEDWTQTCYDRRRASTAGTYAIGLGLGIMVRLPSTVVRNAGITAQNRQMKLSTLRKAFFAAGYGANAANKWIKFYFDQEILYESGKDLDSKEPLVSSLWW